MSTIEDRLRAAYQAKAEQVTDERLDHLAAQRQQSLLDGTDDWWDGAATSPLSLFVGAVAGADEPTPLDLGHRPVGIRHARWLAPALAAAAVAAIAVAVTAIATSSDNGKPAPRPLATRVTSPSPSSSSSASTSAPAPASSTAVAGPPYLPRGQQGTRSQVPWSAVGPGWRLLQPQNNDWSTTDRHLYLYDPAGGRYLITDRVPAGAALAGWSPDGRHAMLTDRSGLYQVQLRTGSVKQMLPAGSVFVSYTQPRGLAFLAQYTDSTGTWRLSRYSVDGSLELDYPAVVDGHHFSSARPLYTLDGTELIVPAYPSATLLLGNDGHFIRAFQVPSGYSDCHPVKLWTAEAMLERCSRFSNGRGLDALLVQPLSGGAPQVLTDAGGSQGDGYVDAWQLSNGDVLLASDGNCGDGGYDVLHPSSGTITALRGPAGVPYPLFIVAIDRDLATFFVGGSGCAADHPNAHTLVDYNMVTGRTSILLQQLATILPWQTPPL